MIAFLALGELGVLGANPFRGGGQQIKGQVSYRLRSAIAFSRAGCFGLPRRDT